MPADIKTEVCNEDKYNPMAEISVYGYTHRFSLSNVPKENRQWLMDVVSAHYAQMYKRGQHDAKKEIKFARHAYLKSIGVE